MERRVASGPLTLFTESFGDPLAPAVLLVAGAGAQALCWPEPLCQGLAQAGFFVLRFDHRDVGLSSSVVYSQSPYFLDDLAQDAVAVLEGWGVARAHVVGFSMGGYVAQLLALDHAGRVCSLTSIASTPEQAVMTDGLFGSREPHPSGLPPPPADLGGPLRRIAKMPCRTREETVVQQMANWRFAHGTAPEPPEGELQAFAERLVDRARDARGNTNHAMALVDSPGRLARLHRVRVPTLVLHGAHDPYLPPAHGEATARTIPGARFALLPDAGHYLHSGLVPELLGHLVPFLLGAGR